jgi:carbon monoxide dehydrogenase subunit G
MRVTGERAFAARREDVFRLLVRPDTLASTLPGVERFEAHDDRHWTAHVRFRLGLAALRLRAELEKVDEREPEHARLVAKGRGPGAELSMETAFDLAEANGGTLMSWSADVELDAPFGGVGKRLLRPLVARQVAHLLDALEGELAAART